MVWSETEGNIDEGTDTMDSICHADGDSSQHIQTCEIPNKNHNQICSQNDSTNLTTKSKNTSKSITKKKKNKFKNRSKVICLNADLDKGDELIESGKENIVGDIGLEKGLEDSLHCEQTIAVETLSSFVNVDCEPDLETGEVISVILLSACYLFYSSLSVILRKVANLKVFYLYFCH